MKRALLTLICALYVPTAVNARTIAFPRAGLEISCSVSEQNTPMRDYMILILEDDTIRDTIFADLTLPIFIQLDLNKSYILEFSKPGFLDRLVLVDTKVPEGKDRKRYTYDFEIDMPFRYCDTAMHAVQPIARICYDEESGEFDYDAEYARNTGNIPTMVTGQDKPNQKSAGKKSGGTKVARKRL